MDATKLAKLNEEFAIFKEMIAEIFSVTTNEDVLSTTFINPTKFIMVMSHRVVLMFNHFANSNIYQFLVGIAIIGIILYTVIGLCDENNVYKGIDWFSTRVIRKIIFLIICLILIFSMHAIVYSILSLFRFIVYFILDVTDSDATLPSLVNTFNAEEIAYRILDKEKILDGVALIDETIARSKEASLRELYHTPWLVSWISNIGLIVVVLITSMKLLIYSSIYVVSISDIILGIKKSRFLSYTKIIISLAFQFTVIALILYFYKITCYPYLNKILADVMSAGADYFKIAMIFVAVRCSEFILILLSGIIANRAFGVKD